MDKQPLLILVICLILGILVQEYLIMSQGLIFLLLLISGISLISILIKSPFFQKVKYYFLGFFFFSIGIFLHFQNSDKPDIPAFQTKENIVFQLSKKLNSNEKNRRYFVEILAIPSREIKDFSPIKTVLSIPKEQELLDFEHFYDAEVYIHRPEEINNNFQFDYKKYLYKLQLYMS